METYHEINNTYDANFLSELRALPTELESQSLTVADFRQHFKSFRGRPEKDIVEALNLYGQRGFFSFEFRLSKDYVKDSVDIAAITESLKSIGMTLEHSGGKCRDLSRLLHAKIKLEQTFSLFAARNLPDHATPYLIFKIFHIDRGKLRRDLAIYYDPNNTHPSRLEKINPAEKITTIVSKSLPKTKGDNLGVETKKPIASRKVDKINYDKVAEQLIYGLKKLRISGALNCELCRQVFKNRKKPVPYNDILDAVDENKHSRAVYDSILRINDKIEAKFDISNVLESKDEKVRIRKKYL